MGQLLGFRRWQGVWLFFTLAATTKAEKTFASYVFPPQWYWDFKITDSKSCGCSCQGDRIACRRNRDLWQKQSQSAFVPAGKVKGPSRWKIRLSCWVRLLLNSVLLRRHLYETLFPIYICDHTPQIYPALKLDIHLSISLGIPSFDMWEVFIFRAKQISMHHKIWSIIVLIFFIVFWSLLFHFGFFFGLVFHEKNQNKNWK